jgi:hypothetical protein
MTEQSLTQERLKELLDYNPDTGIFTRAKQVSNVKVGDRAGRVTPLGYLRIKVDGRAHMAHRLAVLYMNGHFPPDQTDHINGKTLDNRWCNLRCVSRAVNYQNKRRDKRNTSGVTGVYWHSRDLVWHASIGVNGKFIHLGNFKTWFRAAIARKKAEIKYGFHPNHDRTLDQTP